MTAADPDALARLLDIQDHDHTLDGLRHKRLTLPERAELAGIDDEKRSISEAATDVRERRHGLARDQKRLEDEVAMIEERITAEDAKLYGGTVSGVKELQALQDEIKGLRDRQRTLEDQILEVMEAAEPVDAEIQAVDSRLADLDRRADEVAGRLGEAELALDEEITAVTADRSTLAEAVPAELLAEYERISAEPGRVGVARLIGSTCHGCHLELAAVEVDRLKKLPADVLVHCEECGCILVR